MDQWLNDAVSQMDEVYSLAQEDIGSVRIGRAKPAMVQDIKVEAYDTLMTLKELASITAPDPHSLFIKPWDDTVLEAIAKGILKSGTGLTPVIDKNLIRIHIPPLTSQQREEYAKLVDQKAESARVMVRQVRSAVKDSIESQKGQSGVSEDDVFKALEQLQKITDEHMAKINDFADERKKELTTL